MLANHNLNQRNQTSNTLIPGFEFIRKLGQGSTGSVYLVRQINMDRLVAIKVINTQLSMVKKYKEKFLQEAIFVARMNHNNIIKGFNVGEYKGRLFFTMEYVDGDSLQKHVAQKGAMKEKDALEVILQLAEAIHYISKLGIIHRDIKPENIILNSNNIPKLIDFSLVLIKEEANNSSVNSNSNMNRQENKKSSSNSTNIVGTPHYISPEQAQQKNLDFRSDIYSLGACLYYLVTGRTPFEGDRSLVVMLKHITEELSCPRIFKPSLSKGISDLIFKMMAKDPSARSTTIDELILDIKAVSQTGELPTHIKSKLNRRVYHNQGFQSKTWCYK